MAMGHSIRSFHESHHHRVMVDLRFHQQINTRRTKFRASTNMASPSGTDTSASHGYDLRIPKAFGKFYADGSREKEENNQSVQQPLTASPTSTLRLLLHHGQHSLRGMPLSRLPQRRRVLTRLPRDYFILLAVDDSGKFTGIQDFSFSTEEGGGGVDAAPWSRESDESTATDFLTGTSIPAPLLLLSPPTCSISSLFHKSERPPSEFESLQYNVGLHAILSFPCGLTILNFRDTLKRLVTNRSVRRHSAALISAQRSGAGGDFGKCDDEGKVWGCGARESCGGGRGELWGILGEEEDGGGDAFREVMVS
ncbi:hypothetical protein BC829DRAFT_454259 [Chytridium lagenaria]|nr:hypothetical protein BC829DRAFT_454259 [Chytridium lagenaria]